MVEPHKAAMNVSKPAQQPARTTAQATEQAPQATHDSAQSPQTAQQPALVVERIVVRADRILVNVRCASQWLFTTPELVKRICLHRGNLPDHTCVNSKGSTFAAVMDHTPLPHLFEHVVVDLLVERTGAGGETFVGTSEWLDRSAALARVELSFSDDIEAIRAIKDAAALVNNVTG